MGDAIDAAAVHVAGGDGGALLAGDGFIQLFAQGPGVDDAQRAAGPVVPVEDQQSLE